MNRTRALAVVALTLVSAMSSWAAPPPPEIMVLIQKMRRNQPLTSDEQTKLRAWQQQQAYTAGGGQGPPSGDGAMGTMPADIAEIMAKTQRGVPPSADELEKLKAWGNRVGAHQDEIVKDEREKRVLLEGAKPTDLGITVKSPFLDGELRVVETQVVTSFDACDDQPRVLITSTTQSTFNAPVRMKTREPGKALSVTAEVPAQGPFSLLTEPLNGRPTTVAVHAERAGCHAGSANSSSMTLGSGEFNFSSPTRAMVNVAGVHSLDTLRPEVVWQGTQALNAELLRASPQAAAAQGHLPGFMKAAANQASFTLSAEAVRAAIRSGGSTEVSGTYTDSYVTPEGASFKATVTYTLAFRPLPTSDLKMAVLDGDGHPSTAAWQKWLPLPWLDNDAEAKFFGLAKHDPKAGVKVLFSLANSKKCKLHVSLNKVSEHAGVTTNWPVKAKNPRKTLRIPFEPGDVPKVNDDWVVAADGQSADSKNEVSSAILQVASLETAAAGELSARCDEPQLDAVFEPTGKKVLVLPRDDNQNHVGDQYEEDTGAVGRALRSDFDEDENPKPKQRRNGDGYTLFEEYRGFVVRTSSSDQTRRFVRSDWNTKTGFVFDDDKLFEKYLQPFNPMQFEWFVVDPELASLPGDENDPEYRWVNTNSPDGREYTYAKQYAIIYKLDNSLEMNAKAVGRSGANPREVTFLHPMRTFTTVLVNESRAQAAFTAASLPARCVGQLATIQRNDTAGSVIHETGHCLGVTHHMFHHYDNAKPERNPDGSIKWVEDNIDLRWGVAECTMRYNDRYSAADFFDNFDSTIIKEQCTRPVYGFCKADARGEYWQAPLRATRVGNVRGNRVKVSSPSDNCWGQIDIKNDPE